MCALCTLMKYFIIVSVLAVLAVSVVMITTNDVSAEKRERDIFNTHSHTQILPDDDGDGFGTVTGNDGSVLNTQDSHTNNNFNSHREDTQKSNEHAIPNKK